MSIKHARLSASGAERFMECPGSIALSSLVPNEDSEYAAEGTAAHKLAEICLRDNSDAWEHDGEDLGGEYSATPEMAEHVQVYLDEVRAEAGVLHVEHRIENPELGEDFGGTTDALVSNLLPRDGDKARGSIRIFDLKYGAGIPVEAVGNVQMRYYAFGTLKTLGVAKTDKLKVGLTIVQPRAFHADGPIRTEWLEAAEILRWGEEELLPAMKRVNEDTGSFKTGEHCRFCPAKLICPAMKENFGSMERNTDTPTADLSDNLLAEQYDKIASVKMYIKALEDECLKRAMQGAPVPGTKLIYGRSSREWKEGAEQALLNAFGEDALNEPVLKSPAQIDSLPKGKAFTSEHSFKKEGRPTLVPSDKAGVTFDPADAGSGFSDIKA